MIKYSTVGAWEDGYYFEDAVVDKDTFNGTFGKVEDGKFEAAEDATKAIMQEEVGDDAGIDKYLIPAGSHVRVVDLEKLAKDFETVEIYGYPLPDKVQKGDKLKSDSTGALVTSGTKFEVTKILGNNAGAEIKLNADAE